MWNSEPDEFKRNMPVNEADTCRLYVVQSLRMRAGKRADLRMRQWVRSFPELSPPDISVGSDLSFDVAMQQRVSIL